VLCSALPRAATAQTQEYQVKAELLERFTRFVDWPDDAAATHSAFVIGVYGQDPFGTFLAEIAGSRRIKERPVRVVQISDPKQAVGCHVLFIARSARGSLRRVLEQTELRPVLTVADSEGFAEKGVLINFYASDDKVRFEINDAAARRSGLKVSSKLLNLARIVTLEN
jgi:hypothetical protein